MRTLLVAYFTTCGHLCLPVSCILHGRGAVKIYYLFRAHNRPEIKHVLHPFPRLSSAAVLLQPWFGREVALINYFRPQKIVHIGDCAQAKCTTPPAAELNFPLRYLSSAMFKTCVSNVFVPIGYCASPQNILNEISTQCVDSEILGNLVMRVFEYKDIYRVLKISTASDLVFTYPDVFPLGRHYSSRDYIELVKQTVKDAKGYVIDRSLPPDFDIEVGAVILACIRRAESACINSNLAGIYRCAYDITPTVIPSTTATHVGSKLVSFVATGAEPETSRISVPSENNNAA